MLLIHSIRQITRVEKEMFSLKAFVIDSALSAIALVGMKFAPTFLAVPLTFIFSITIGPIVGVSILFLIIRLSDIIYPQTPLFDFNLDVDEALDDHIAPLAQVEADDAPEIDDPNNNLPNPTIKNYVVLSEECDPI